MKTFRSLALSVVLLLGASEARAENPNPGIMPIGHALHGNTYSDWSGRWWQWAYSYPVDTNPVYDDTGEFADEGQSGAVWLLAGSFGETLTRTVTIPGGKWLFLPIANSLWINIESLGDAPWSPEQREVAFEWLDGWLDGVEGLGCEIDGVAVSDIDSYRVATAPGDEYTITFPEDNLWGIDAGDYGPTVDVGYYLMLRPLSPGEHTIRITAEDAESGWALDVTYDLTVERRTGRPAR